jgi:hypothetical protein
MDRTTRLNTAQIQVSQVVNLEMIRSHVGKENSVYAGIFSENTKINISDFVVIFTNMVFLKHGFERIERSTYRQSSGEALRGDAFDRRDNASIFLEAWKTE